MNNVIQSMTPCSLLGLLLLRIQYLTTQDTFSGLRMGGYEIFTKCSLFIFKQNNKS